MDPLHVAVRLWGARWQHEKGDVAPLAFGLKLGHELEPPSTRIAFTLKGRRSWRASRKVTVALARGESPSETGGGMAMHIRNIPAADDIPGCAVPAGRQELFEGYPWQRPHIQSLP